MSGILTLATQSRVVSHLPIVWFTDNEAVKYFLDKDPPINPRLGRAYLFLSQFSLKIFHLPGIKNELCDFLSRNAFEDIIDQSFDELARDAFVRMDTQIDLYMESIFVISDKVF